MLNEIVLPFESLGTHKDNRVLFNQGKERSFLLRKEIYFYFNCLCETDDLLETIESYFAKLDITQFFKTIIICSNNLYFIIITTYIYVYVC